MKDFIKWLGVNEKVAKVAVWMLIFMVFLIVINTALNSLGFPHYAITYDNLKNINVNQFVTIIFNCIVCILNFYAVVLLIFRTKEIIKLFKWALLYMILNWFITTSIGYIGAQVFIFLFFIIFSYLYSNRNWKYLIYGFIALTVDTIIQGITYYFKARLIDISKISEFSKSILSFDYFIIIGIIILVKEIYLKKRGEKKCGEMDQLAGYGGANSTKKTKSPKKQLKN